MTTITIPWKKHAKQRPRNGGGHTYTPKPTKDAERIIRNNFEEATGGLWTPRDHPLRVAVHMSKEQLELNITSLEDWPAPKGMTGDVDNYLKTVCDALNGVAWTDDRWIYDLRGVKQ